MAIPSRRNIRFRNAKFTFDYERGGIAEAKV